MKDNEIIAERKLIFIAPGGGETFSSIQLGHPYDNEQYGCCCDIEIPDIKKRKFTAGVDSMQAIQLSMLTMFTILDVMQSKGWKFLWPDTREEATAKELFNFELSKSSD